jgi:hypothetical protein
MLKAAGCEDVEIDFDTKTATCTVPADVDMKEVTGAVGGKFSAKVKQ